jgi:hypothetical protein
MEELPSKAMHITHLDSQLVNVKNMLTTDRHTVVVSLTTAESCPASADRQARLAEIQRATSEARREFEAWLKQIDPESIIEPPASSAELVPLYVVTTSKRAAELLCSQQSRPHFIKTVERNYGFQLE